MSTKVGLLFAASFPPGIISGKLPNVRILERRSSVSIAWMSLRYDDMISATQLGIKQFSASYLVLHDEPGFRAVPKFDARDVSRGIGAKLSVLDGREQARRTREGERGRNCSDSLL